MKYMGSNAVDSIHLPYLKKCKIVGNIYQNPKLLEAVSSKNKA